MAKDVGADLVVLEPMPDEEHGSKNPGATVSCSSQLFPVTDATVATGRVVVAEERSSWAERWPAYARAGRSPHFSGETSGPASTLLRVVDDSIRDAKARVGWRLG